MSKSRSQRASRRIAIRPQRAQRQLGKRIAALRKRRGITREQLAKACGVKCARLARMESGQVNLSLSTLILFGKTLGVRLERIFRGIR